jgi:MFS family permease
MTTEERQRRGWWIVASLFLAMVLVNGPVLGTPGVFFMPLLKQFGVQRAQLSLMSSLMFVGFGIAAPASGWLLDRIEARIVMVSGAVLTALTFVALGRVHSFTGLVAAYMILGFGAGAATFVPTQFIITNWFGARRGTALGIAFVGMALGPMLAAVVAQHLISTLGWRVAYQMLPIPILLIAIPVIAIVIRSRPPQAVEPGGQKTVPARDGLEVGPALRSRSFWLLAGAFLLFGLAANGIAFHLVPYLRGRGYDAGFAALALSLMFGAGALGDLAFGLLGDRMRSRVAMGLNLIVLAVVAAAMLRAPGPELLMVLAIGFGIANAGPTVLEPMVAADCFGLKRFGSLTGLVHIGGTAGAVLGPVIAGAVFDRTGSYWPAFDAFIVILIVSGTMVMLCTPLAVQNAAAPHPAPAVGC